MWQRKIGRSEWVEWLALRSGLSGEFLRELLEERVADEHIGDEDCTRLAAAVGLAADPETIRFTNLVEEGSDVFHENLAFLLNTLEHGGKKALASKLGVDPTTISRWLNASSRPSEATLHQLMDQLGISTEIDLRTYPIFLSFEPISMTERRQWLISRIEEMTPNELLELYPALHRIFRSR